MNSINSQLSNLEPYVQKAITMIVSYAPQLLLALVTLFLGLWIIRGITKVTGKTLERRNVDPTLRPFLTSLGSLLLKALLIISVASMVGIETTSFVAVIGAAGLAVGLALQGSLANFAGGVLILLFRPFKVGDFILAQGEMGTVKEIQAFCSVLTTPDNKTVIIPNGALAGGVITNVSTQDTRRVDMVFGIGYSDEIPKAKQLLQKIVSDDSRVLKDPAPVVAVSELGDSSVNFVVRPWCKKEDYWDVYFDLHERVKLEFDKNNVSIPFPQRDIHVHGVAKEMFSKSA